MERTAVGAYLRTTQAWAQELCEKETLDFGIAFVNPRHAALPEACQFREVVVEPGQVQAAFEQAESWFTQRRMRCLRWAPAEMQPIAPIETLLVARGFVSKRYTVLGLSQWKELDAKSDLRILPARAMRSAFRATFRSAAQADAWGERLDDPQLDMLVAVGVNGPVGRCGLYQVGDIARVIEPVVMPSGDSAVERPLMAAVLTLARRLALKTVLIQAPSDAPAVLRRYESYGFSPAGEFVEFDREAAESP